MVKAFGGNLVPADYKFDINRMPIMPILRKRLLQINDNARLDRVVNIFNDLEQTSKARGFEDLLEARQLLNKLKFGMGA